MALRNPLVCLSGRSLWLRFAFFVFLRTWAFQLPEMQLLYVQMHPFSHVSTRKFSPTQNGSPHARAIFQIIPVSEPVTRASFLKDQIVSLRAGACGF